MQSSLNTLGVPICSSLACPQCHGGTITVNVVPTGTVTVGLGDVSVSVRVGEPAGARQGFPDSGVTVALVVAGVAAVMAEPVAAPATRSASPPTLTHGRNRRGGLRSTLSQCHVGVIVNLLPTTVTRLMVIAKGPSASSFQILLTDYSD